MTSDIADYKQPGFADAVAALIPLDGAAPPADLESRLDALAVAAARQWAVAMSWIQRR